MVYIVAANLGFRNFVLNDFSDRGIGLESKRGHSCVAPSVCNILPVEHNFQKTKSSQGIPGLGKIDSVGPVGNNLTVGRTLFTPANMKMGEEADSNIQ